MQNIAAIVAGLIVMTCTHGTYRVTYRTDCSAILIIHLIKNGFIL